MIYLFMFLAITFLFFFGIGIIIKNKFNIEGNGFFYAHINKFHRNGEILILVLFLLLLGIRTFLYNIPLKPHSFLVAILLMQVFRAFMEWKYDEGSKKYILTILSIVCLLIIFLGIGLFFS